MQAQVASITADTAPTDRSHARLISIPFLFFRSLTAAGAFSMGLVQTLVFARVLSPEQFSVFILVGAIGYSLWLCDLGLAKILFVELRAARLTGQVSEHAARHATAVVLLYVIVALVGSLGCFGVMIVRPSYSILDAADFALFFLFVALNLAWFSLRSISVSVDEYVFYEKLELIRRAVNVTTMLAMLIGLPFTVFLVSSNALWAVLLALAVGKLIRRGALVPQVRGFSSELVRFFRVNWHAIARSGTSALSDLFTSTFPYCIVPIAFGLGAPVIILEATFRIFRGSSMIYAAACDLAVPGQTRALAARDARKLVHTTLLAGGLCLIPAAVACSLLIFAAQPLFSFLLHAAATVPPAVAPILVVLVLASLVQMVSQSLLQYTGFFREIARIGFVVAATMVVATVVTILAKFGIVGFLAAYAVVFTGGAIGYAYAAINGPVRIAASQP
jgi:O-antigen/teichoic acid export membrane protein